MRSLAPYPLALGTYLDFRRDLFLRNRAMFCLPFTSAKTEALRCGDLSGSIIHPVFVPLATLLGYMLWQETNAKFDIAQEQEHLKAVDTAVLLLRSEEGILSEKKLIVLLQAHILLLFYYWRRKNTLLGTYHYTKCVWIAKHIGFYDIITANVYDVSATRRPPGFIALEAADEQEERVATLSQIVYIDSDVQIYKSMDPKVADETTDSLFHLKVRLIFENSYSSLTLLRLYLRLHGMVTFHS